MKQKCAPRDAAADAANDRPVWLFVDDAAAFGGHEQMLLRWMQELQAQGRVRVRLLARAGSRLVAQSQAGWHVAHPFAPAEGGRGRLRRSWADAAVLRRVLRAERPALAMFASGCASSQAALVAQARLAGVPAWVYVPLVDRFAAMGYRAGHWQDRLMRAAYGAVPTGWVTITPEQANHFTGWARPRGPVLVLPNTVSPAFEAEALGDETLRDAGAPLRVLVLGRLDAQQKGIDLLLDHLQRAAPLERAGLAVSLIGEGPYRAEVETRLRHDAALRSCVRLADWTPTREAMAAHDVLLLPSRYEGVPLVMLEAMALGLPVAAADLPGTRSHLAKDCLFPVGDIASALRIARRLGRPEQRQRIVQRNRAHYERHASGQAFAQATARLTSQLAAGMPPGEPTATTTTPSPSA